MMARNILAVAMLFLLSSVTVAQPPGGPGELPNLKFETGKITLGNDLATIDLPPTLKYLNGAQTKVVVEQIWGNPPGETFLGMVLPAKETPLSPTCLAAIITYEESGYVSDKDASSINFNDLLKQMQASETDVNAELAKQGYEPRHLVGWAKSPSYDAASNKLFWAKEIAFGSEPEHTLNYCIRVLGRRGVLEFNFVGSINQLAQADTLSPEVMKAVQFQSGNRYADFDPKSDKVAAYGIAALVAGGVAAKAGLFKGLIIAILAAKKFLILGAIAIFAFLGRFFRRG